MRELIIGVVVDVLRHVRIQHLKSGRVGWIATSPRDLTGVRYASEFVVLYPKVGLEDFRCGRKPEQRCVPRGESPAMLFWTLFSAGWKFFAKQADTDSGCTGGDSAALQERTSIDVFLHGLWPNWTCNRPLLKSDCERATKSARNAQ